MKFLNYLNANYKLYKMKDVLLCALKHVRIETTGLNEDEIFKLALELSQSDTAKYEKLASRNDCFFISDASNDSAYICNTITGKAVDTVYFSFNEKPSCRSGKDYNFYFPE